MARTKAEKLALIALGQNGLTSVKTKNANNKVYEVASEVVAVGSATTGGQNFYQDTEPTKGMEEGNLWFDTSDNELMYRHTGEVWELAVLDDNVVIIDGGKVTAGSMDANRIATGTLDAGQIATGQLDAARINVGSITVSGLNNNLGWTDDTTANSAYSLADSATQPSEVATAINNNTTTINGAKITTGSIDAAKINVGSITVSGLDNNLGWTDDTTANSAYSTANTAYTVANSATQPSEVATAINNNTTTINGAKITTGTIDTSTLNADYVNTDLLYIGANPSLRSAVRTNAFIMHNANNQSTSLNYLDNDNVLIVGDQDSVFGNGVYATVRTYGAIDARSSITCAGAFTANGTVSGISAADVGASPDGHTHTGVYAPDSHTHSAYSLTSHTHSVIDGTNVYAGYSVGNARTYIGHSGDVYIGTSSANVYIEATSYPFTGGHAIILDKGDYYSEGDIVLDIGDVTKHDISNGLGRGVISTSAKDKRVFGVITGELTMDCSILDTEVILGANALGEGYINVCGENGSIEVGDYICSSNTKGKGMRQDDDLLHNYTIAKARESVEFAGDEIVQVACTYHAG